MSIRDDDFERRLRALENRPTTAPGSSAPMNLQVDPSGAVLVGSAQVLKQIGPVQLGATAGPFGPVTGSVPFTIPGYAKQVQMVASMTAFTTVAATTIGVELMVDGAVVPFPGPFITQKFDNPGLSHSTMPTLMGVLNVPSQIAPGNHTIGVRVRINNNATDFNDYVNYTIMAIY